MNNYVTMLHGAKTKTGDTISAKATDEGVLVTIQGREELPALITSDDAQIVCVTYLCGEHEIRAEHRTEMLERMLAMNVPMPLSAFGIVNRRYVLFGALPATCAKDDLITEIDCLSENTLDAIEALDRYLITTDTSAAA